MATTSAPPSSSFPGSDLFPVAAGSTEGQSGAYPMASPLRGVAIDRYLIVDELGAGGMGVVYKAYDPDLGRLVALKLVRAGASSRAHVRLLREARAIARLSHPNVVAVHDVGELPDSTAGEIFIAMEFVEGQRLREWLIQPRSQRTIIDAFLQAARGLAAAHDAGLVHRDFKPDNVLIGLDGRVRVVDFGLARAWRDEDDSGQHTPPDVDPDGVGTVDLPPQEAVDEADLARSITPTGAAVGTPRYMAPEQHLGHPCDARADQFAWAIALYEALTRSRPFDGTGKELRKQVVLGEVRPFSESAGVPSWLQALVKRALSVAPDHRWPSMLEIIEELTLDRTAHRLSSLDGSGNTEPMVAAFPPPDAAAAHVHRLRTRLEQAWGKKARGAYQPALAMARQLVDDAARVDYLPLFAAALYLRGNLEHRTGDPQSARDTLYEAARVAARAQDDWQVANTWIFLVQVLGVGLGQTAEADTLARVAEVALDRVGENASLRSRLLNYWGAALSSGGRYDEAAAQIARAVELDTQTHGPEHAFVVVSLLNLGEAWLDGARPDHARPSLERARAICQPEVRSPTASRTRCLALLGRLALAEHDATTARGLLERAVSVWERQPGRDHALADALIYLAAAARIAGDLAGARAHAERATLLARTLADPRLESRASREHALAAMAAAGRTR